MKNENESCFLLDLKNENKFNVKFAVGLIINL